jgi:hypothetical protein
MATRKFIARICGYNRPQVEVQYDDANNSGHVGLFSPLLCATLLVNRDGFLQVQYASNAKRHGRGRNDCPKPRLCPTGVCRDISTATLTFSGPADAVNFAEWVLPQVDKTAGDSALHEYRFPSGDIGRVGFLSNVWTPQSVQELMTVVRTVAADATPRIQILTLNHAIVLRSSDWGVAFAEWIIDQIDRPIQQKPDLTPREFAVRGPDFRNLGHGASLMFLANMTGQKQMQQVLQVLRTVDDLTKVFSYAATHAVVFRADDVDLHRAEWLIQELDATTGHPPGTTAFTAPAGDDVTRDFYLGNATEEWVQSAVNRIRSEFKISKIFYTTAPANIVVRGTTDKIAAVTAWMTSHNALLE